MRRRTYTFVALAAAIGIGLLLFSAYNTTRRNVPGPGQVRIQQQGQNLSGDSDRDISRRGLSQLGINSGSNPMGMWWNRLGLNRQSPQNIIANDRQKAENIRNQLSSMGEMNNVNVIVAGNTAVVGYSPSKAGSDANAVKNMVADKVKGIDPTLTNVAVSESADIVERIKGLANAVKGNRSANEIKDEVTRLFQDITSKAK